MASCELVFAKQYFLLWSRQHLNFYLLRNAVVKWLVSEVCNTAQMKLNMQPLCWKNFRYNLELLLWETKALSQQISCEIHQDSMAFQKHPRAKAPAKGFKSKPTAPLFPFWSLPVSVWFQYWNVPVTPRLCLGTTELLLSVHPAMGTVSVGLGCWAGWILTCLVRLACGPLRLWP